MYISGVKLFLFISALLFLYHGLISFSVYPEKYRKNYYLYLFLCFLCSFSSVYSLLAVQFDLPRQVDINGFSFIYLIGFGSYHIYIKIIQNQFGIENKVYEILKKVSLGFVLFYGLTLLGGVVSGKNILVLIKDIPHDNYFLQLASPYLDQTVLSKMVIMLGTIFIVFANIYIFRFLRTYFRNEKMLQLGIIVSIIVIVNDILIGMNASPYLFPVSFVGFGLEVIRFHIFFQSQVANESQEKAYEIQRLSKALEVNHLLKAFIHELRGGLQKTTHLFQKLKDDSQDAKLMADFHENQDHLFGMAKNFVRLSVTKTHLDFQFLPLGALVTDLVSEQRRFVLAENIHVEVQLADDLKVYVDRLSLQTALVNLMSNSNQYIQGSHSAWIRIGNLKVYDEYCEFTYENSGPALDTETCDQIFQPMWTTASHDNSKGVGMSLVQECLKKVGGTIETIRESQHPRFRLTLPTTS